MEKRIVAIILTLLLIVSCDGIKLMDGVVIRFNHNGIDGFKKYVAVSRELSRETFPDSLMRHFPSINEDLSEAVVESVSTNFIVNNNFHYLNIKDISIEYIYPMFYQETIHYADKFEYHSSKVKIIRMKHESVGNYQEDQLLISLRDDVLYYHEDLFSDSLSYSCVDQRGTGLIINATFENESMFHPLQGYCTGITCSDELQNICYWILIL